MTKIELIFMIITHALGIVNLFVVLGSLARKLHASVIEKYVTAMKADLVTRFQGIEAELVKLKTSAVSSVGSLTKDLSQPVPPASSPVSE